MRAARAVLPLFFLLSGCVNESGARLRLFTATAPVIAIMYGDLFVGTATGHMDMTGTIDMRSVLHADVRCAGSFRYTGMRSGVADVQCNDTTVAHLSFNALSHLSGYGYGRTNRGPASFTFGLNAEQASKYLVLPTGRKIVKEPEGVRLAPI